MKIVPNIHYTKSHEWFSSEGDTVTVGITDHAQEELTDIVYVEPPGVGSEVKAGVAAAIVESVKAASDIYSPLSGTVTEINGEIVSNPALLNTDPFGTGWIYKMKPSSPVDYGNFLTDEGYRSHIAR